MNEDDDRYISPVWSRLYDLEKRFPQVKKNGFTEEEPNAITKTQEESIPRRSLTRCVT